MNSHNSLFLKLFFLFGVLSGCVSVPPLEAPELEFRAAGKLAVRDADDAFSANFLWQHASAHFEIDLWGPLGQGRTKLVGDLDGGETLLTILMADGTRVADDDVDALMQQALGWSLPIEVLPEWIRGRTAAGWPVEHITPPDGADSRAFRQAGWRVTLSRFSVVAGERLPGRLVAERDARRVTIVVREWS